MMAAAPPPPPHLAAQYNHHQMAQAQAAHMQQMQQQQAQHIPTLPNTNNPRFYFDISMEGKRLGRVIIEASLVQPIIKSIWTSF